MQEQSAKMRRQTLANWRVRGRGGRWVTPECVHVPDSVYVRPRDPVVGEGCTIRVGSDRWAGTIVKVSPTMAKVWIRLDKVWPTKNCTKESQRYMYTPNPEGTEKIATRRPAGIWRLLGGDTWGACTFGERDFYKDPSF